MSLTLLVLRTQTTQGFGGIRQLEFHLEDPTTFTVYPYWWSTTPGGRHYKRMLKEAMMFGLDLNAPAFRWDALDVCLGPSMGIPLERNPLLGCWVEAEIDRSRRCPKGKRITRVLSAEETIDLPPWPGIERRQRATTIDAPPWPFAPGKDLQGLPPPPPPQAPLPLPPPPPPCS